MGTNVSIIFVHVIITPILLPLHLGPLCGVFPNLWGSPHYANRSIKAALSGTHSYCTNWSIQRVIETTHCPIDGLTSRGCSGNICATISRLLYNSLSSTFLDLHSFDDFAAKSETRLASSDSDSYVRALILNL